MSGELVKPSDAMAVAKTPFALQPGQVYTSLDLTTAQGALTFYKARQKGEKELQDLVNTPLEISDIVCHFVDDEPTQDGEIPTWKRWVLITPSGQTISTGSGPVDGDIQTLCYILGMPPWKTPPIVTPIRQKSKRNPDHSYIQLVIDDKRILDIMEKGRKRK
jgi:hypothetical protein